MPVAYEPPITRGGVQPGWKLRALRQGPALARSRGSTRWHRIRSATYYPERPPHPDALRYGWPTTTRPAFTAFAYWCGQHQSTGRTSHRPAAGVMLRDALPDDGMPLCGTCEGRAIGAGHPPVAVAVLDGRALLFTPTRLTPPRVCPGRPWVEYDARTPGARYPRHRARCLLCGETDLRIAGGSRGYGWTALHPGTHEPGPGLVEPCSFHAWGEMVAAVDEDGVQRVMCRCELPEPESRW